MNYVGPVVLSWPLVWVLLRQSGGLAPLGLLAVQVAQGGHQSA